MSFTIRAAKEIEAETLTELALRAKGHWGYDAQFLLDCRADLTVTPEFVRSNLVFVLQEAESIVGYYCLERISKDTVELVHLFVEPTHIGSGYGRQLLTHAEHTARRHGFSSLILNSDPFAEAFYLRMGAKRIGEVTSPVRPGRLLPKMHISL